MANTVLVTPTLSQAPHGHNKATAGRSIAPRKRKDDVNMIITTASNIFAKESRPDGD